jgi:hypothetical protein
MPAISPDGYIRLSLASLCTAPLLHLFSTVDHHFLEELQEQTVPARSAGFCEWKSATAPEISMGWGWFIHDELERLFLAPDAVRSNVMLIDALGYDLGAAKTSNLFCTWLNIFEWQETVNNALGNPLGCSPC